jgi:hypothetical protein
VNHTTPATTTAPSRRSGGGGSLVGDRGIGAQFLGGVGGGTALSGMAVLLALTITAVLVFAAPWAQAASPPYVQVAEIQNAGSEFYSESVAVNPHNGHIYVADSGAHVIRDYSSASDPSPVVWNGGNSLHGGGTPAGEFTGKLALAVENATGDVYVADSAHAVIDKFDQDGNLVASFGDTSPTSDGQLAGLATPKGSFLPPSSLTFGLAVDQATGNLYVLDAGHEHEIIDAFTSAGEYLPALTITEKPGELYGCEGAYTDAIAVDDTSGELLATDSCDLVLYRFELSTGAFLGSNNGSETPAGSFGGAYISVAVDQADGDIFVADNTHQVIDRFTPAATYVEPQVLLGGGSAVRSVGIDPSNGDVYAPDESSGAVRVFQIKQPAQPVAIASVSEVTATTATLRGGVNPEQLPTTYHFEYISQADWQANGGSFAGPHPATVFPVPDISVGSGEAEVQVAPHPIAGLLPGATYRYRLVATNSLSPAGGTAGPDATFTTQPAAGSTLLPDDRGWELVSPPLKQGIPLGPISREGGVIQAAADGSAITYWAKGSILPESAGDVSVFNSQELSTRGASGWATQDITTPHQTPIGATVGRLSEYRIFSQELTSAALEPLGATPLSAAAGERTPYLRSPDGAYTPLVHPGNVPFGTHFGDGTGVTYITATPDLSHVLLVSSTSLVSGFETGGQQGIYEWSSGALRPVSYVPPAPETHCGGTGPTCVAQAGAEVGNGSVQVRNAISTDGSRVVFSVGGRLYLRDTDSEETVALDAQQGGAGNAGAARFQYASEGDSRVFFTDAEQLTEDSTAAPGSPDLYMCQIEIEAGHLACALTDITANTITHAEPASVQGAVVGGAGDGSSVYFVANGALTTGEGAVSGDCNLGEQPASDRCNLYRYDVGSGELGLVAVLSGGDYPDWSAAGTAAFGLTNLTSRVSPNGRFLAFMSQQPLTGYDNRDARSGVRDQEVFLYDTSTGRLACASCNPTGARPQGVFDSGHFPGLLVDAPLLWRGQTLAASIPGWTGFALTEAQYQSRYLSNSGRLFFNAADALVPRDTNGTEDVYQWEPPSGVAEPPAGDTCTTSSSTYSPTSGGCVDLISSGTSGEESAFMDADETGENVFFLTASRLTARDEDSALDLYDARVGGGEATPVKPVECAGDACQRPAVPPDHPTPGTSLVNGPENTKECPKGKVKQKGKCVKKKQKAKKHKHKKSKKKSKGNGKKRKQANSKSGGHK